MKIDLDNISVPDAQLVQHGLKALGFYEGTTRGRPGPKTKAAYRAYLTSHGVGDEPPLDGEKTIPQRFVEVLLSKVGVREVPRNSNRGPDVEEFQASTWLDGTGWPWCAAFVCWGILKVSEQVELPFKRPQTAGAWDFERWARENKVRLIKPRQRIKAGDIVVFTFSHIGVAIEDEKNGTVRTVEGNTDSSGSREGGGVYIKTRSLRLVRSHIRLPLS